MVFFMEDPLTAEGPHRQAVEEEDEQLAAEIAPQYAAEPLVQWDHGAPVQGATVVFLLGQPACLLADAFFPGSQPAGAVTVPELVRVRSPLEEEYGTRRQPVHACTLRTLGGGSPAGAAGAAGGVAGIQQEQLVLVAGPKDLPEEQAAAWARGVLAALAPRRVLVAATLLAMQYRGPGSPADEDLIFSLHTSAAAAAGPAAGAAAAGASKGGGVPPPLPEATLVGGLPAALLTDCELGGLPASLMVGVQQQQVPDAQFLFALGSGARAALARLAGGAAAGQLPVGDKHGVLSTLGAAADAVYRSSASSFIFS